MAAIQEKVEDDPVERAAELLLARGRAVAFTGAGVSTESGIPDFRGPAGLWRRFGRADFSFASFMGSEEGRRRYWTVGRELYGTIRSARPNAAHRAFVGLEALGFLDGVITQNVDDLHQRAGLAPERVIELHGNATRVRCLACGQVEPRETVHARLVGGEAVPACHACGGILKPATVLFGEPMPAAAMEQAETRARSAGVLLVVGASLAVYPAAYLPLRARESGVPLVVMNVVPTRLDHLAAVVLPGKAGETLVRLVERVEARLLSGVRS